MQSSIRPLSVFLLALWLAGCPDEHDTPSCTADDDAVSDERGDWRPKDDDEDEDAGGDTDDGNDDNDDDDGGVSEEPDARISSDDRVVDAGKDAGPVAKPSEPFTGEIESAAMEQANGGWPVPYWLYKGGVAPDDTDGLLPIPEEAVKHRAANPDLWTEWRRTPDGVERKIGERWKLLAYKDEYGPLPKGSSLTGTFSWLNNAYEDRKYRFNANFTFDYCSYTTVISRKAFGHGTYEIDGFVIRLIYSNATEAYSFIYDPKNKPNTLWFDEVPYKRDNTPDTTFTCP